MSEAAQVEELPTGLVPAEPIESPEIEEMSTAEVRARGAGWVPEDEFEGDPDSWRDYRDFNTFGDLKNETRQAQAEAKQARELAEESIVRNNRFREAQNTLLQRQIADLQAKLDDAVETADVAGAKEIQAQIDTAKDSYIPEPETPAPAPVDTSAATAVIEQFNAKNIWIHGHTPKAVFAKAEFIRHLAEQRSNYSDPKLLAESAIALMNASLEREYPDENPNRDKPSKYKRGRTNGSGGRSGGAQLTMDDLSREEMGVWNSMQETYKDENEFLEAVADSRKGV